MEGFNEANPEKAFKEGMRARLQDQAASEAFSIERHLQGGERNISPYISTTEDVKTAVDFSLGTGKQPSTWGVETRQGPDGKVRKYAVARGIVYQIKPTASNMVFVEDQARAEGVDGKDSVRSKFSQKEWAAYHQIDAQNIYSAQVYERVAEYDEATKKPKAWSQAAPTQYDLPVDGKKLKSTLLNDQFSATHSGFTPPRMPCSAGAGRRSKRQAGCNLGAKPSASRGEIKSAYSQEAFDDLAKRNNLSLQDSSGKPVLPAEIHQRIQGYGDLSPQIKVTVRNSLQKMGKTTLKGAAAAGTVLWAKGIYDSFASDDATSWDKAAAITSILPFAGCAVSGVAEADRNQFNEVDTLLCLGADALSFTPAWPAAIAIQATQYFSNAWKAAQIPSITEFVRIRNEAWKAAMDSYATSPDGLQKFLSEAHSVMMQQVESEKAIILHNASEEIAENRLKFEEILKQDSSPTTEKRVAQNIAIAKTAASRRAREQVEKATENLRKEYQQLVTDSIKQRAADYNLDYIRGQVDIERWKEDSWQSGVAGPRQSREDRQEYLAKVAQRLKDPDMALPVPDVRLPETGAQRKTG
ncbi:hypothetical protein ACWF95_38405 [Streptomyces vinaceus]